MWRFAGLSVAAIACGTDPDAHFSITRPAAQEVTVQLCDPAEPADCRSATLFRGPEPAGTVKTLDVRIDDATIELDLIFSQLDTVTFCTRIGVVFDAPIDATIALTGDAATPPAVTACESCTLEPCGVP